MRLLVAFLWLLVAGALGAPPALVRTRGREEGPSVGSSALPVPLPRVAMATAAATPGTEWRVGGRSLPCRPRQRPPFFPCRTQTCRRPPARSLPVSW